MRLSYDKNGELVQLNPEWGDVRHAPMVEDSHLAVGEYRKNGLQDLQNLRAEEAKQVRNRAMLLKRARAYQNHIARLKAQDKVKRMKQTAAMNGMERFTQSELYEQAIRQPNMGVDYTPALGNPLIGFGSQGEIVLDPNLRGEIVGEAYEAEEFGRNTLLRGECLAEDNNTMGFPPNPFKTVASVIKTGTSFVGSVYDVGSSGFRTAVRLLDNAITGGKISARLDDADATVKDLKATVSERIDDIATNASLTAGGILSAAKAQAIGLTQGKLAEGAKPLVNTFIDTASRTFEDTKEAWFDTKTAAEETGTGRALLKTTAEIQQKTDPGWLVGQTHNILSSGNIPLISEVYNGIDLYSGGLLTRAVSAVEMPGKLIRGNAGLQVTDEKVSKAEFITNMVFYAQTAITVVTFGAAGAVLIIAVQSMKNGPLNDSKEGHALLSIAEVASYAYGGGAKSVGDVALQYTVKEMRREAAEEATKQVAKASGMNDTSQAMLQAALNSGNFNQATIAAGKVFAKDVIISEVSKKTGSNGGLLTSMALEATWATAGANYTTPDGKTPSPSEVFTQSVKQQMISHSQKRAIGLAASQAKARLGTKAGGVISMATEEMIMSTTEEAPFEQAVTTRIQKRAKEESIVAAKTTIKKNIKGSAGVILAESSEIAVRSTEDVPPQESGDTITETSYTTSLKKLATEKVKKQAKEVAMKEAQKQALKTLPKSQVDNLVSAGEIGYSAYESDKSFSDVLQTSLKEKAYNKVVVLANKKGKELINKQRQKVDEITAKAVKMKEDAAKLTEMNSAEIKQKAQAEADKQIIKVNQKVIDEVAEVENQIYDLQVARDHALKQAELAPQKIQDQLEENANAVIVKVAAVPNAAMTKAERTANAAKLKAQRAQEMVERNKKIVEQFNATEAYGKSINKMGKEARKLREKALGALPQDAEAWLMLAIEIEMKMIEMYLMLQAMEQRCVDMQYEASVLDAQAASEIAAAEEGRYPVGLFQAAAKTDPGISYIYDYRHPMLQYGLVPGNSSNIQLMSLEKPRTKEDIYAT